MFRIILRTLLVFAACSGAAFAHHGNDFFMLEDYEMPPVLGGNWSSSFDWEKYNSLDAFGAESMIMMTLAPRLAFSISASANDEGEGWRYSSLTPRFHFQLTPPKSPIHVSFSIGYQIADGSHGHANERVSVVTYETVYQPVTYTVAAPTAVTYTEIPVETTTVVTTSSGSSGGTGSGSGGGSDPNPCDPNIYVDCPPASNSTPEHAGHTGGEPTTTTVTQTTTETKTVASTSTGGSSGETVTKMKKAKVKKVTKVIRDPGLDYSGSIHNHDANLWTGRLVVEAEFGKTKALLNLIGLSPEGAAPAWGYAVGLRHQFTHDVALGVEAIGDFASDGMHEMVLGGYYNVSHDFSVKLGAGFGLTEASSDFSLRTGFTLKF